MVGHLRYPYLSLARSLVRYYREQTPGLILIKSTGHTSEMSDNLFTSTVCETAIASDTKMCQYTQTEDKNV